VRCNLARLGKIWFGLGFSARSGRERCGRAGSGRLGFGAVWTGEGFAVGSGGVG